MFKSRERQERQRETERERERERESERGTLSLARRARVRALSLTVLLYCARAARALSHAPPDYRVADHFSVLVIFKVFRAVTAGVRGGGGGAHAILGGGSPVTGSMSLMSSQLKRAPMSLPVSVQTGSGSLFVLRLQV
jgi:hypothetical protein